MGGGWVACRIILSAPVPFPFLWTLDFRLLDLELGLGIGTWNWVLGLGLGLGLGLDNCSVVHDITHELLKLRPGEHNDAWGQSV